MQVNINNKKDLKEHVKAMQRLLSVIERQEMEEQLKKEAQKEAKPMDKITFGKWHGWDGSPALFSDGELFVTMSEKEMVNEMFLLVQKDRTPKGFKIITEEDEDQIVFYLKKVQEVAR